MSELYTIEIEDDMEGIMEVNGNLVIPIKIGVRDSQNVWIDTGIKLRGRIESDTKEAYQKGLSDAWECAKKINCLPRDGGLSGIELDDIFNMDSNCTIMKDFSASEALEKIKSYEEEQKQIRVGDEVKAWYGNAIITGVDKNGKIARYFYQTGENGCDYFSNLKRTGRHFDAVETLLEILRESEDV